MTGSTLSCDRSKPASRSRRSLRTKIKELPGATLQSWMAESCTGSYPLSVVASSRMAGNAAPANGQFLVLTVELTLNGAPWIGAAPLMVGQQGL